MLRALLRRLQLLFLCGGVLLCGLAIWKYVQMRRFQAAENRRLEEVLRSEVPAPPSPAGGVVPAGRNAAPRKPGSVIGRIEIPRLDLSAIVLEGSDSQVLSLGVGRIPETSEPGGAGNLVLGGHRDTFFRPLRGIRKGDSIRIRTPEGAYQYTVDWTRVVNPEATDLLKATPQPSLTLVTCYPFHYVGPAPQRFIVRAHQDTEVVSTSATQTVAERGLPIQQVKPATHLVPRRGRPRPARIARRSDSRVPPRPSSISSAVRRPSLPARVLAAARRRVSFKSH